ncbi:hypothetical protein ABW20_dc0110139 [Dactylellina cionopaga]|nr:hypothetical protein ABW20_dc0110139 [Dactylellina cionopaga]
METPATGSAHDPVRQQFLRHLHWYLSQITNEMVQEGGENYDRKKRNDKFFNSLKFLANHVVEFNRKQELLRESTTAPPRTTTTTGAFTNLQGLSSSSSSHAQQTVNVTQQQQQQQQQQQPELTSLSHSSRSKRRSFSEAQAFPATIPNIMPAVSRPSVSPATSTTLEASFSSLPSSQSSRAHSSESVPTVGAMSAPRSPAIASGPRTANNTINNQSSLNAPSTQQGGPSTNFGFAVPQRRTAASLSSLQRAAISTTAEIEASLAVVNDFMVPQRDVTSSNQQTPVVASRQQPSAPQQTTSNMGAFHSHNNEVSDSTTSLLSRKRKRQKKQWCHLCNDHKEGFRGPHELARHMNIQHQTKKTVFIVYDDSPEGNMLKDCKHCSRRKIYGQDYNAACHLRRAHFNKRLKTDTPEEREYKQLHPDMPPMEELRPWLRKCLVDVSMLTDKKYVDNNDAAILKVEHTVKNEDSSSDQDKDVDISDDEPQHEGPATPPPEPEAEPEYQREASPEVTMTDSMLHNNFMDFDFNEFMQQPEFTFTAPPFAPPPQPATVPRTNTTPAIFALQMQSMGIQPGQIIANEVPDFIGIDASNLIFTNPFDFNGNNVDATGYSFDDFDQFLQGPPL